MNYLLITKTGGFVLLEKWVYSSWQDNYLDDSGLEEDKKTEVRKLMRNVESIFLW